MAEIKKEPENLDEYIYELYGVKTIQQNTKEQPANNQENSLVACNK